MNHPNVDRLIRDLYRAIESETISREFITDDHGVSFLAGSQGTSYVWLAFRIAEDAPIEVSNHSGDEGMMTFRVIRLDPHRTESFGVSRQTGHVEKQSNFNGCKYMIGDVHVRTLTNRENFGSALRQIQEAFHNTVLRRPMTNGHVNGARSLMNIYREWIADDFRSQENNA